MEAISYRLIRNRSGDFEELLEREGSVILNKNRKPLAIILKASEESYEETLRLVSMVRAQMAVAEMRKSAQQQGLDNLSEEEIQAEIDAVRSNR